MTTRRFRLCRHFLALAVGAVVTPPAMATDFSWTSGDFNTGVTAPEPLLAADTLFIQSGDSKRFVGSTFTNQGLVRWQNNPVLQGGNGASILNSGTWQSEGVANALTWNFGGQPAFTNTGTFNRIAGGVTSVGSWNFVNNGGLIDAQVGDIAFNGSANTFNAGSRFSGAGRVLIASGASFNGAFQSDNLVLAGGTHIGTGAVLSAGVAQAAGNMGWSGGDMQGSWSIGAGATLTASGADSKRQIGSTIVNDGTVRWNTTATLQGGNSSAFTNNGLTEATQSATFTWNYGGQPTYTNNSGATVRATSNATLTFGQVALTSNGGGFEAHEGSAIVFQGDSNRFNNGTSFIGVNRVSGNATYVGNIQSNGLRWMSDVQTGGDGNPGSKAVLNGAMFWQGGDLQGKFEIASGAILNVSGADSKRQIGSTIVNDGTVRWNTTEMLQGGNSSAFINNGRFELATDADVRWNYGGQAALQNNGVFVKTGGAGESSLSNLALSNNGTLDVRTGSIRLPANFVNTGRLTGTGTFSLTGTLANDGRLAPGASPGTLTIDGDLLQSVLGTLEAELESMVSHDLLLVNGNVSLGGTLALICFAHCSFAVGDEMVILDATGDLIGSFDSVTMSGFVSGGFDMVYDREQDRVLLRVTETVSPSSAVPEPGTCVLLLTGLAGLGWITRRRRTAPIVLANSVGLESSAGMPLMTVTV